MLNASVRKARKNIRESVERGALLLDKRHPRWFRKIDLDAFDLSSGSYCICGQLDSLNKGYTADSGAGNWAKALRRLFGRPVQAYGTGLDAKYGFMVSDDDDIAGAGWRFAERVWKEEIRKRRKAALAVAA